MKKLFLLYAACLLVLTGCTNRNSPAEPSGSASPQPTAPLATPLATDTPPVETVAPTPSSEPTAPTLTAIPEPTETFDPDKLTLNDFPTQLVGSGTAIVEGDNPLYLIAQIPEHDTWLYGMSGGYGLILRVGTHWKTMDLGYLTPRAILPVISYGDFDGDLELELALLLYTASGTGVSVWDLHIIEFQSDTHWADQWFAPVDYHAILEESVNYVYNQETPSVTISLVDSSVDFTPPLLADGVTFDSFQGGECGVSIAEFTVNEDSLKANFGVALYFASAPTPVFVGNVQADVIYTGSAFGLTDFTLTIE